jgi:hypothetical protein
VDTRQGAAWTYSDAEELTGSHHVLPGSPGGQGPSAPHPDRGSSAGSLHTSLKCDSS